MGSTRFLVAKGKRRCPGLVIEEEEMRSFLREGARESNENRWGSQRMEMVGKKRNDMELPGRLWLVSGSFERQSSLFLFLFYSVLLGIGRDNFFKIFFYIFLILPDVVALVTSSVMNDMDF